MYKLHYRHQLISNPTKQFFWKPWSNNWMRTEFVLGSSQLARKYAYKLCQWLNYFSWWMDYQSYKMKPWIVSNNDWTNIPQFIPLVTMNPWWYWIRSRHRARMMKQWRLTASSTYVVLRSIHNIYIFSIWRHCFLFGQLFNQKTSQHKHVLPSP